MIQFAARRPAFVLIPTGLVCAFTLALTIGATEARAAQARVDLGTATSFAVIGGSTVTNTGPSVINGDLALSPGTAVTGFKPPAAEPGTVNGAIHKADAVADTAQRDESTAYADAAGRSPVTNVATELGGTTLVGGVYASDTLGLTGALTLNGGPNAVWIFKAASTLITATNSRIVLTGGASACNVFWQIGSSATLGAGTRFTGTVLASTSITAVTGATVQGRLFAQTGAVTLDTNVITTPDCAITPPVTTPPVTTPPVTTPPVTTPPVTTPPVTTPPVTGSTAPSGSGSTTDSTATVAATSTRPSAGTGTRTGAGALTGTGTRTGTGTGTRTGTGAGLSRTTTTLASTGSSLAVPLVGGLLAILLGSGLMFATRRTHPGNHRR